MSWHRDKRCGRACSCGFTLLELLVTISVVAIIAGVGMLSQHTLRPSVNLGMAARQVVMDLKIARLHAITRNVNYRVMFPASSRTYRAQRKIGTAYSDEGNPIPLPDGITIASCTATASAIAFRPRGNAATFGTVTLQTADGVSRRIIVDIAGEVRVE